MKTSISSISLAVIGIASLAFAIPMSVARAQDAKAPPGVPAQNTNPGARAGQFGGSQAARAQDLAPAQQAQGFGGGSQIAPAGQPGFTPYPSGQMGGGMAQARGGGPATMVADGDSLYILQGNRIFRVNKNDLRVVKEGMLPMDPPMKVRMSDGREGYARPEAGGSDTRVGGGGIKQ